MTWELKEVDTVYKDEEQKMNWFDRWFERQCKKAWANSSSNAYIPKKAPGSVSVVERNLGSRSSINFTIYPAAGGWVIEHAKYTHDSTYGEGPSLTIVNHGEELGKTVEHIISLESLRS